MHTLWLKIADRNVALDKVSVLKLFSPSLSLMQRIIRENHIGSDSLFLQQICNVATILLFLKHIFCINYYLVIVLPWVQDH